MYLIKKFSDCWAIFNLENDANRPLSEEETLLLCKEIPALDDPLLVGHFTDTINCLENLP